MDDKGYLLRLIREGEHQQQDFKYRVADACKLAKSVSAFANTDGGRLLIGVRDDGHLSGVRSEEETPAEVKPPTNNKHDKMTHNCVILSVFHWLALLLQRRSVKAGGWTYTGRPTKENKQNNMCNNKKEIRR